MDDDYARWESADRLWKNTSLSPTALQTCLKEQLGAVGVVLHMGDVQQQPCIGVSRVSWGGTGSCFGVLGLTESRRQHPGSF